MPYPRTVTGLWHVCALSWTYKKKHKKSYMAKDYCNLQCFQEKNYKDNFRKKNKKNERKKTI
jgi:hypothetical protein